MIPPVLWPLALYGAIFALHLMLPARRVTGYVRDASGAHLRYRLNGLPVFFATVGLWALCCRAGWLAWDALYLHRWAMAPGPACSAWLFTLALVLSAPKTPGQSLVARPLPRPRRKPAVAAAAGSTPRCSSTWWAR